MTIQPSPLTINLEIGILKHTNSTGPKAKAQSRALHTKLPLLLFGSAECVLLPKAKVTPSTPYGAITLLYLIFFKQQPFAQLIYRVVDPVVTS